MNKERLEKEFSFRTYAWKQFKKNTPALISLYILIFLIFIAVFRDFIANDQPLYAKYQGESFFPAFQTYFNPTKTDSVKNLETGNWERLQFDIVAWKETKLESAVWAPIAYSPDKPDRYNREYVGPFDEQMYRNPQGEIVPAPFKFRHYLGTNNIGQDIAAGLVHGTAISLTVGLIAVGIAAFIGVILGSMAGYFGDTRLRTRRGTYYFTLIGIFLGLFYSFGARKYAISDAISISIFSAVWQIILSILLFAVIVFLFNRLGWVLSLKGALKKHVFVPIDSFVSRTIEVLNSLPILLLIITIAAIAERSLGIVMVIIGITTWTGIARFTRAEFLRTRSLEYIAAAKSLGYSESRIMFKHALPNSFAPVFIAIAFGIASAILVESALSFLGIGVPDDVVTWGSLLNQGRHEFEAWWLVIFPGVAIFLTVTIYNLIGEGLRDALDPRLKR